MPRSSASPTAASGTVKWFNSEKGYGFVCQDDGGPDVFAHFSAIAGNGYRELTEGEKVAFDITQGQKAPVARTAHVASWTPRIRYAR
ncbi:cold shock domain-containing protein [Streptomyces misionensis]|uniref:cold shock domain-containing protein n=1 Tax=Streptomyces misionensis TaxID=67331 RepID=UPI0033B95F53